MSLEIVNEDFVMTITPHGAWTPGTPTYTIFKAEKLKVNSKFALIWHIIWEMLNKDCVLAGYNFSMGSGIMFPTGIKCFTNGDNPFRRTDSGECSGFFTSGGGDVICSCTYTITHAGQVKAKCN